MSETINVNVTEIVENIVVEITEAKDAYQLAVAGGFVGSREDWKADNKGTDGLPGADGQDGTDGQDGQPGTDGQDGSPGTDGQDGSPGADGSDANVTNTNVNLAISTNTAATLTALGGTIGTGQLLLSNQALGTGNSPGFAGMSVNGNGLMLFLGNNGSGFPGISCNTAISITSDVGGVSFGRNYPASSMRVVMALSPEGLMVVNRGWDHANASSNPESGTVRAKVGNGANIAGGHLKLIGGLATGNSKTGDVMFMRSNVNALGSVLQTEIASWVFDGQSGNLIPYDDAAYDIGSSIKRIRNLTASSTVTIGSFTFGTKPTNAATGRVFGAACIITDSLSPVLGSPVAGGGAKYATVRWNGTDWIVVEIFN